MTDDENLENYRLYKLLERKNIITGHEGGSPETENKTTGTRISVGSYTSPGYFNIQTH